MERGITLELNKYLNQPVILDRQGLEGLVEIVQQEMVRQNFDLYDENIVNNVVLLAVQVAFDGGFKEGLKLSLKTCYERGIS